MKTILAKLLVLATLACPLAATAQTHHAARCQPRRGVNARQQQQQGRIRQGVRSGELTRREAARLAAEQARIQVRETYARHSGGEFTARERARIERAQNRASRDIYRQKHDAQDRN